MNNTNLTSYAYVLFKDVLAVHSRTRASASTMMNDELDELNQGVGSRQSASRRDLLVLATLRSLLSDPHNAVHTPWQRRAICSGAGPRSSSTSCCDAPCTTQQRRLLPVRHQHPLQTSLHLHQHLQPAASAAHDAKILFHQSGPALLQSHCSNPSATAGESGRSR